MRSALRPGPCIAMLALAAACGGDAAPTGAGDLRVLSVEGGSGQEGFVGELLSAPVRVRVAGSDGRPANDAPVRVQGVTEGGIVVPSETRTGADGVASFQWRLGPLPGLHEARFTTELAAEGRAVATALPRPAMDLLVITNLGGRRASVVEISASASTIHDVTAEDGVLRLWPRNEGSASELFVLADGFAPELLPAPWTSGVDTVRLTLRPSRAIPLTIWIMGDYDNVARRVEEDLRETVTIFATARLGITVGDVRLIDAPSESPQLSCSSPRPEGEPGRINIYYTTGSELGYAGYACSARLILITGGRNRLPGLLPHELGHTFSLAHRTENENIMNPKLSGSWLTLGQVYRSHYDSRSAMNQVYGLNLDKARACVSGGCLSESFGAP